MKHRIRFFKQHSNETCGIACALILLDYYDRKVSYPTPKMEAKLYKHYKSAALKKGVPGAQLACLLARNKLDVKLIHSSENILENRDGYFAPEVFDAFLSEYTAKLHEKLQGLRCETTAAECCDGNKTWVVPTVYSTVFY